MVNLTMCPQLKAMSLLLVKQIAQTYIQKWEKVTNAYKFLANLMLYLNKLRSTKKGLSHVNFEKKA